MNEPAIELADVVRRFGHSFLDDHASSSAQRRVLRDIAACRTAALGGHVSECDQCGERRIAYNSCRNRHCPKCQRNRQAEWTSRREAELLPVPYFHVVFTLPHELGPVALQNQRMVYGLLFRAAAETLQEVAADPKHLGARIGVLAVLHTWGQNLMHHPHVHCVVPAGGLSPDGDRWIGCRRSVGSGQLFFLPVRVLSRVFRGKFVQYLKQAFHSGHLSFHGRIERLAAPARFERWLDGVVRQEWVVYAKRPFGGPRQVLRYLARYTHRVAISNQRLIDFDGTRVRFRWKDYADGGKTKVMSLEGTEFLRRFLLHTLPQGFQRIRYYGFLANRNRGDELAQCRVALGAAADVLTAANEPVSAEPASSPASEIKKSARCPTCGIGRLMTIELVPRELCATLSPPHFLSLVRHDRHAWNTS